MFSCKACGRLMLLGVFHFQERGRDCHLPILRHCALAPPEYKLVEVAEIGLSPGVMMTCTPGAGQGWC
jgi:hypothetical protein